MTSIWQDPEVFDEILKLDPASRKPWLIFVRWSLVCAKSWVGVFSSIMSSSVLNSGLHNWPWFSLSLEVNLTGLDPLSTFVILSDAHSGRLNSSKAKLIDFAPSDLTPNFQLELLFLWVQVPWVVGFMFTFLLVANRNMPFSSSAIAFLMRGSWLIDESRTLFLAVKILFFSVLFFSRELSKFANWGYLWITVSKFLLFSKLKNFLFSRQTMRIPKMISNLHIFFI